MNVPNKDSKRSKRKAARGIDINGPQLNKRHHKRAAKYICPPTVWKNETQKTRGSVQYRG